MIFSPLTYKFNSVKILAGIPIYSLKDAESVEKLNEYIFRCTQNWWGADFIRTNAHYFKNFETQSERVVRKFGTTKLMAQLMNECGYDIDQKTIENWKRFTHKRQKYLCNGRIPAHWMHPILVTARLQGIVLDHNDVSPKLMFAPSLRTRLLHRAEAHCL